MARYDVHIYYKKETGRSKKELEEVVHCKDMMEATMTRLNRRDDPDIKEIVVRPHHNNDFPFDQSDLFED